jgi:hypothetical protein
VQCQDADPIVAFGDDAWCASLRPTNETVAAVYVLTTVRSSSIGRKSGVNDADHCVRSGVGSMSKRFASIWVRPSIKAFAILCMPSITRPSADKMIG